MPARVRLIWGLASVVCLLLVGTADAAERFASPTGGGSACSQKSPCAFTVAVENAKGGDEVIVGSGTYELGESQAYSEVNGLVIRGDPAGPPPTISSESVESTLALGGQEDRLSYVNLVQSREGATGLVCSREGLIDRVKVTSHSYRGRAILAAFGCDIRNSIAVATGANDAAIEANSYTETAETALTGVTAVATDPAGAALIAVSYESLSDEGGALIVDVTNSILTSQFNDVLSFGGFTSDGTTVVNLLNSNVREPFGAAENGGSVTDLGGNQSAQPLFVNAATGDYREATGSPTIDAGFGNPGIGPVAFEGENRVIGPAPDIGAFETTKPPVASTAGTISALKVKPTAFIAASAGGATASAAKGGRKGPVGATVSYSVSASATVAFTVERKVVKKRKGKKKVSFKKLKGGFSVTGAAGANSFKFTGRLGKKALSPGSYRLVGAAGGVVKRASFTIARPSQR